jgi:MoaA/NifB/PqqE/SkfB family radical SAM enzyme
MENLSEYLNRGVEIIVMQALKATLKNPLESAFILKYMSAQQKAFKMRLKSEEDGVHIPPFLIASISAQCNLFCSGCYARAQNVISETACRQQLSDQEWERIFREAEEMGISFILLAGGEPLMRRNVIAAAAGFSDIIFPVFTNGTMFDDEAISLFNKNRNLVPILSLEGDSGQTNARRGAGVYSKLLQAMAMMKEMGILFGASITVTKQNFISVTDEAYIKSLHDFGCKVVIFVEYVPVAAAAGETAPNAADRITLLKRQDKLRAAFDSMLFIAFPGDEEEFGGCLAAGKGFFHINPEGGAEPCPFSPFSDTSLKTGTLKDALISPLFRKLNLGGFLAGEHVGGCTLFGREAEIKEMVYSSQGGIGNK